MTRGLTLLNFHRKKVKGKEKLKEKAVRRKEGDSTIQIKFWTG